MKKICIVLLLISLITSLSACDIYITTTTNSNNNNINSTTLSNQSKINDSEDEEAESREDNYYTVTWLNYQGVVLEVDYGVPEGSFPNYDGITPTQASTDMFRFQFSGWSPTLSIVGENIIYTAQFDMINRLKEVSITVNNFSRYFDYETEVYFNLSYYSIEVTIIPKSSVYSWSSILISHPFAINYTYGPSNSPWQDGSLKYQYTFTPGSLTYKLSGYISGSNIIITDCFFFENPAYWTIIGSVTSVED